MSEIPVIFVIIGVIGLVGIIGVLLFDHRHHKKT